MRNWILLAAATLLLAPAGTPLSAQAAPSPATTTATPAPAPTSPGPASAAPDADPALWVVRDADTTIYLFGTVHVLRPDMGWFDEAIKQAFDASSELTIETLTPETPETQQAFAAQMLSLARNNVTSLSSRLSMEQRAQYQRAMDSLGVPTMAVDNFDPWFVSLQLALLQARALGANATAGAETVLKDAAAQSHKTVTTFETADEQLNLLDSTPVSEQIVGLMMGVSEINSSNNLLAQLLDAWARGDADATATLMNEAMKDTPETRRLLLTDRNRRWATAIKTRMEQPGTVFVAVGAGHLAGADSVQHFLEAQGMTVTRVPY